MWCKAPTYVIEEADPGGDVNLLLVPRAGLAVEVDRDADLRLGRLALDDCCPCCHFFYLLVGTCGCAEGNL